jgi:hypothetical protein
MTSRDEKASLEVSRSEETTDSGIMDEKREIEQMPSHPQGVLPTAAGKFEDNDIEAQNVSPGVCLAHSQKYSFLTCCD